MKVIAFAASSSKSSINKKFASYAVGLLEGVESEVLDLNNYELPLFSEDKEKEIGKPPLAQQFLDKLGAADAIVVSFAEHNGSYSAAYKNLFDWCSRIEPKVFQGKSMILLATSPGARGGASVLAAAVAAVPRFNGDVKGSLSLPSFYDNFNVEKGVISNAEIQAELAEVMAALL